MQTRSRSLALLLFDEVELLDVAGPLSVLSQAGRHWNWRPFKVSAVAEQPGKLATRSQLGIVAERALADCPEPELVIVPGGYGARKALSSSAITSWLAHAGSKASVVSAVGNGVLLLAKAGLLGGARVIARSDIAAEVRALEPSATVDEVAAGSPDIVVESNKLITASGSGTSLELALRITARTLGPKLANSTAQSLGVPWLAAESNVTVANNE